MPKRLQLLSPFDDPSINDFFFLKKENIKKLVEISESLGKLQIPVHTVKQLISTTTADTAQHIISEYYNGTCFLILSFTYQTQIWK